MPPATTVTRDDAVDALDVGAGTGAEAFAAGVDGPLTTAALRGGAATVFGCGGAADGADFFVSADGLDATDSGLDATAVGLRSSASACGVTGDLLAASSESALAIESSLAIESATACLMLSAIGSLAGADGVMIGGSNDIAVSLSAGRGTTRPGRA
jgi:hypothetical protein